MVNKLRDVESHRQRMAPVGYLRVVSEFVVVGICTLAFAISVVGIGVTLLTGSNAGSRDFVDYWASARQLISHSNPYNEGEITHLEEAVGLPSGLSSQVTRSPPFALPLMYPFGLLNERVAAGIWSLMLLGALIVSVRLVWILHGRPDNNIHLLGYTFAAVLSCLAAGQMSLLVLLGLALFLRFNRTNPFIAGAALWLCALKPHLFLPFGVVVIAWLAASKGYRIAAGALGVFLLSLAAIHSVDPLVWAQYRAMMRNAGIGGLPIPCVAIFLRQSISPGTPWLQYLPAALGCIWAMIYFYRHRRAWDWIEHGSLVVLVSVVMAPYSWFMDQVVLIPALLHALYGTRSRLSIAIFAMFSAVIEIAIYRGVPLVSFSLYLWTAPAWLGWYLWTRAKRQSTSEVLVSA